MASYTVIQDIEAEDKLLGPLSLRQFIYAVIVVGILGLMYLLLRVNFLLAIPLIPFAALFGILAAPFGHDQSSEIWLLAKIRFFLKPRTRLWDQSGLQELVTVTAPKRVEEERTDGLDQTQVKSRLQALANTLDTRGWALKGAATNLSPYDTSADRLVSPQLPAAQVADMPLQTTDDMLDMQNNPVAQKMEQMVAAKDQQYRASLINRMNEIRANPQAMQQTQPYVAAPSMATTTVQPAASAAADQPLPHLTNRAASYGNTHVLRPAGTAKNDTVQKTPQNPVQTATTPVPEPPKPDILKLASNDDLSVATIARQANKTSSGNDEVVISLR